MIKKVEWIRDTLGVNILAIPFTGAEIEPFVKDLQEIVSEEDYKKFSQNRIRVEGGDYLLVVANDIEIRSISPSSVDRINRVLDLEIADLHLESLGVSQDRENICYYIICHSKSLSSIREYLWLDKKPLFINLGWDPRDVSPGLKVTKLEKIDKFLKLLSENYYKEGNFEFIKSVENYHLDKFDYIYPLKIENTTATFRDDNFNYFTISLINDKFRVVATWNDPRKLPYLAQTLIDKKLKKININD